ncbi:Translation factor guf1 mitochondrial [Pichia californica]|uniref:Translation factor guf1 mitochondrial n=1 Tax=Pichia californica TaxID=460514 RepID=A0A9P7BEM3_9ASCO|nr:Translation factor guf1 mitochondrial [[Candida] californica]KAG0688021.1 Translation factor guf1 mitochondrial [[Candida] californica]
MKLFNSVNRLLFKKQFKLPSGIKRNSFIRYNSTEPPFTQGSEEYKGYLKYELDKKNNPTPILNNEELFERISNIPLKNYRNFIIVAHIDHGKSTLSDRLLEITGVVNPTTDNKQVLDKLDVERERGITVKAQTVSMIYHYKGEDYMFHLVDSPGHVDFRLEVIRSYASCQGALLLVDASEGIKAQTVANFYIAYSMNLHLIPIINKIDLDTADIPRAEEQIEETFELLRDDIVHVSAKTGLNVEYILPKIIENIPSPPIEKYHRDLPFRAQIVDSWYDAYVGVIMLVNVVDGSVKKGDKVEFCKTGEKYEVKEVGIMYPDRRALPKLVAGQVAYIIPGFKDPNNVFVGDTLRKVGTNVEPLIGFEEPKPMVFVGAFPADGTDFKKMEESLQHLFLNDRSVVFQRTTSNALGQGWKLGFLGSLHASIFKERLEKEHGKNLIITAPTVPYKVEFKDGKSEIISNPDDFPDGNKKSNVIELFEPFVEALMTFPKEYTGSVMTLCENNRGIQKEVQYLSNGQTLMKYFIPTAHLIDDFFGKLKGVTKGYASLDYDDGGYRPSDIYKMELLVNGESIDALSTVLHKSQIEKNGREFVKRLKEFLRIQQFEVIIQAKANGRIIARETIKARRKDVLAKLHASDISRRKKLLVKQKEGKKQLKSVGKVNISNDAFQAFLRRE